MKCYVFIGSVGVNNEHNIYNAELITTITTLVAKALWFVH